MSWQVGAMSVTMDLRKKFDHGTTTVVSVAAAPSIASALSNRDIQNGVDGLVHSESTRAVGTVQFGALPSNLNPAKVRDALAAGKTTAVVATGGVEDNGPYLATGKHDYILRGTSEAIARKYGLYDQAVFQTTVTEATWGDPLRRAIFAPNPSSSYSELRIVAPSTAVKPATASTARTSASCQAREL